MHISELSINPRGEWSVTKAKRVLEIINPEAAPHKLFFDMIDITNHGMPHQRVMLVAYCLEHEIAVCVEEVCPECLRLVKV